ncbi:MAG: 2-hydroxyacyl-CoA dehydratase [Epulopiscium sp.]|nr:2-hydroxyacyl-CoA dehydratase [Candidatus Epulonipiscium sp.]
MIVLDNKDEVVFKTYRRHYSDIKTTIWETLEIASPYIKNKQIAMVITGSGGLGIANKLKIDFVQEVIACGKAIEEIAPETDVSIELGGEDAKITYFDGNTEQRMNGTCAGGTGAFIDQMASLLQTDALGLNELARNHKHIYPVASRCGVFAKTDVQSLLNEGMTKEDIAASIFQAVVNQTISGLAQGRPIKGKVAFLGGPLHFLPELRNRFIETLDLMPKDQIIPDDSQYFVVLGAALSANLENAMDSNYIYDNWNDAMMDMQEEGSEYLEPLFKDMEEYENFKERHQGHRVKKVDISSYKGTAFLGIDAGSTTTKVALVDDKGGLLYSYYSSNLGDPLTTTKEALNKMYKLMNKDIVIGRAAVTGYGENLLKTAFNIDEGEVETVAHYKGAEFFLPGVDAILDVGGQDMKYIQIQNGAISSVMLNEACSSGCGSFIETFASSLSMPVEEFAKQGLRSDKVVDLGTRCTVFMNSKVKQVQKEGASVEDISAGISYSVIKNALFKVIRMTDPKDLGENIVVQGGTFHNEAVLRAMEKVTGREVIRPDIAGIMGAFGAALVARDSYQEGEVSTILSCDELDDFRDRTTRETCKFCTNRCKLTIHHFQGNREFIMGNRCEQGAQQKVIKSDGNNLYEYKYKRIFDYKPRKLEDAPRGVIGMPRVLNMYEDYPLWFTIFDSLGYRVQLSRPSSPKLFKQGMESIPSESVCYPAKLAHGHIGNLLSRDIKKIFYPSIPYNEKEDDGANNQYNCPIVISYPETIGANVEELQADDVKFIKPFLSLHNIPNMKKQLAKELESEGVSYDEVVRAVDKGYEEWLRCKEDIQKKGEEVIEDLRKNNKKGILLAGRPYHIDPEVNHGMSELIHSYGFAVLCEDSIAHLGEVERPLRVVDQWTYHSRLYRAATYVAQSEELELIQLTSFGCGLDAVTTDQVEEILDQYGKIYTSIKIDEISNLGAARIRIRSLIAALEERERQGFKAKKLYDKKERKIFTRDMRENHTILAPQMSPIHFELLEPVVRDGGYNIEVLPKANKEAIDIGLQHVHNDACYPAIITIGQMLQALQSGKYDINNTSVVISQTGGGCRATNYIAFLRKTLEDAGFGEVPVISLNTAGLESNPGFTITPKLARRATMAVVMGDALMTMTYRVRPYELGVGSTNELCEKWKKKSIDVLLKGSYRAYKKAIRDMVKEFDNLPIHEDMVKPKVGVVGEILVKFHPDSNNHIVETLEKEGAEAVVPDLTGFFMYTLYNAKFRHEVLGDKKIKWIGNKFVIHLINIYRNPLIDEFRKSDRFTEPKSIDKLAKGAKEHISLGNQTGEGWFLTAEMVDLIKTGVNNIVCIQPFACLPNHVTGKGMIKELKRAYPLANIAPIDYDPGSSEVNQLNRIKLMLSVANKNLAKEEIVHKKKEKYNYNMGIGKPREI